MQDLEYKYLQIIKELVILKCRSSKNLLIRLFIWFYKALLRKRHKKLVKQFEKFGGDKKAFLIWNNLLLKHI